MSVKASGSEMNKWRYAHMKMATLKHQRKRADHKYRHFVLLLNSSKFLGTFL